MMDEKRFTHRVTLIVLIITLIETVGLLATWDLGSPPSAFRLATSAAFFGASRWVTTHPSQALFSTRVLIVMLCVPIVAFYKGDFVWSLDVLRVFVCLIGINTGAKFLDHRRKAAENGATENSEPTENKKIE